MLDRLSTIATQAASSVGSGRGPVYGTAIHKAFADAIRSLDDPNLTTEQTYLNGRFAVYGTPGGVRADVVEGPVDNPTAIFDLKTGSPDLIPRRIQQFQRHLPGQGQGISITEVRP